MLLPVAVLLVFSRAMGYVWLIVTFSLWALAHSVTASRRCKSWVRQQMGDRRFAGFYRLFYNAVSAITFVPVLAVLAFMVPDTPLWQISSPGRLLFLLLQLVGLAGLGVSLLQTDALSFVGLRQAVRYFQGLSDPEPAPSFVANGVYGVVRHPLYFFSLMVLWFTPIMTLNWFLFNILTTIYFWMGARHEERRLEATFGEQYRRYQQQVPAFIPYWPF